MATVARYIIILDRMDDDDQCGPDGHEPTTDKEGMEQVADELQAAMEITGQPAGFFRVVARTEVAYDSTLAYTAPDEDAHRMAVAALNNTHTY